jgi:hypothetical protein
MKNTLILLVSSFLFNCSEVCLKLVTRRKQALLQLLQVSNKMNGVGCISMKVKLIEQQAASFRRVNRKRMKTRVLSEILCRA